MIKINIEKEIPENLINYLKMIEPGEYLVDILRLDQKTLKDCRKHYFAFISEVSSYSGIKKQTLHAQFKETQEVSTTTTFSLEDWIAYIKNFKQFVFFKLDIVL